MTVIHSQYAQTITSILHSKHHGDGVYISLIMAEQPFTLSNIYLSSHKDKIGLEHDMSILDEVKTLTTIERNAIHIVGGDLNVQINANTRKAKIVRKLANELNLSLNDPLLPTHNRGNTLDYIMCSNSVHSSIEIATSTPIRSDHYPLILTVTRS